MDIDQPGGDNLARQVEGLPAFGEVFADFGNPAPFNADVRYAVEAGLGVDEPRPAEGEVFFEHGKSMYLINKDIFIHSRRSGLSGFLLPTREGGKEGDVIN